MASQEMPAISASNYTSNTVDPLAAAGMFGSQAMLQQGQQFSQAAGSTAAARDAMGGGAAGRLGASPLARQIQQLQEKKMAVPARRYVQVFIADPDPKVPLNNCLLYSSEPKMTDLTDEELFFEVEIKRILDEHNEKVRTVTVDKTIKDRTQHLEAARIRDLRMTVVTIAQF